VSPQKGGKGKGGATKKSGRHAQHTKQKSKGGRANQATRGKRELDRPQPLPSPLPPLVVANKLVVHGYKGNLEQLLLHLNFNGFYNKDGREEAQRR